MKSLILSLIALAAASSGAAGPDHYSWKYYRPSNTGIQGDYCDGIYIDSDFNPWIGGYDPSFEEGGIAKLIQAENRWINFSNVDYREIGHPDLTGVTRVSDIQRDSNGTLWMGTGRGALSFDPAVGPKSLKRHHVGNSAMPGGWCTGVETAPDETIWFSSYSTVWGDGGVSRYDLKRKQWTAHPAYGEGTIAVQRKPTSGYYVWAKHILSGNMARYDSQTNSWTQFAPTTNAPRDLPGRTCTDASGNTWFYKYTDNSGFVTRLDMRRPDGTWWNVPLPTLPAVTPQVWAFHAYGDRQALLVDGNNHTWQFNGASWIDLGAWREGAFTSDVRIDGKGNIWVVGIGGAAKRDPGTGQWQRYRVTNTSQPDFFTRDLTLGPNQEVMANANAGPGVGGLTKFDGTRWINYNNSTYGLGFDFNFSSDNADAVLYRPSTGRYVANPMYAGLFELNGNSWMPIGGPSQVEEITEDSQGRLWALGPYFDLRFRRPTGTWADQDMLGIGMRLQKDPTRPGTVVALTMFQVMRTDGTYRFSRTVEDFPQLEPQSDTFQGMAAGPDGIVWIGCTVQLGVGGTGGGLIRLDTNTGQYTMQTYEAGWNLPGQFVQPLAVTPDGRLWFAYDSETQALGRGLAWTDGTQVKAFPAPFSGEAQWGGLPHAQISDLEVKTTEKGYELWMTCVSRGIAVLKVTKKN